MNERFTQRNPNGESFRIPVERFGNFEIKQFGPTVAMFGDIVDRLGRYEAALTVEETEAYARRK